MTWTLTRTGWVSGEYRLHRNARGGYAAYCRHRIISLESQSAAEAKKLCEAHAKQPVA